jgi:formylglycine-generating enzyme required for sulfatase activity
MVLAIITVFWLLATGVAVQLQVTPAQAQLDVTGSWLTPRIGEQLFLRPGRYVLHAQLPGYAVRELPFEVTGKTGQSLKLALDKLPGKLQVTVPASGTLRLSGGEPLAVPAVLNVSAGHHPVEINVPGYLPWSGEIEIQGEGRAQTLAPTLLPNSAIVNVSSTPAGAALLLRGIAAGTTPFSRELPAGSYALELRMPGFRPWTTDVLVKAGVPQTIGPVQLGLPDATLMVRSTPANARIMVGGVYRGQTPLRLTLRAATETAISLTSPGYEEAQRSVRLGPATGSDLAVELTPILGSVQIRTEPADAEVWIDGTLRGKGSQTLQLPAIAHKLEVRRAGYQGFNAEFTPRPAFEQVVDAQLHTEAEQQQARMPATLRAAGSMDLRLIPAGRYIMGSARREAGRRANEGQRPVELRRRFYLGVHEVTNAEFRRYRPEHKSGVFATVSLNLDNQPAVQLTWQDAAAYCNWLSQQDGLPAAYEANNGELTAVKPMNTGYRLPSEAEWEWAARYSRGVAALRYPWGDALPVPANSGNYADVTARTPLQEVIEGYQDGFLASAPVGSYTPSELGVYDLGGNVSEWTVDVYATSFSVAAEALDPMYLATGTQHSVRGASWRTATSADLRTAARAAANAPRDDLGFRVARYAE